MGNLCHGIAYDTWEKVHSTIFLSQIEMNKGSFFLIKMNEVAMADVLEIA